MTELASQYVVESEVNESIVVEVPTKDLLQTIAMFQKDANTAEVRLSKNGDFPCLRVNGSISVGVERTASFSTEIPVIVLMGSEENPCFKLNELTVPTDDEYDTIIKFPQFTILRKYVDIYKKFKTVDFNIRHTTLQLTANQIGSKVSTTFDGLQFYKEGKANVQTCIEACVDAKKVALFLSSVLSLHSIVIHNLLIGISHKRMMMISFTNEHKNINFHFVIPTIVNDDDIESADENEGDL
jgi:hypothetical protein